jgi:hypothetical protein
MMEQLLTEKEILDYLMTSDFNEGLTMEECKFLLLKYRSFYRVAYSVTQKNKDIIEEINKKLEEKENELKLNIVNITKLDEELKQEKNRKLTLKERFLGKKIDKNV